MRLNRNAASNRILFVFTEGLDLVAAVTGEALARQARALHSRAVETKIPLPDARIGVAIGKMLYLSGGCSKGGQARSRSLSPERRKEIAAKASKARWGK